MQSGGAPSEKKYQYYLSDTRNKRPSSQVREDALHRKYVSDVVETRVHNMNEAQEIIRNVMSHRTAVETRINSSSSRSHLVSIIKLVKIPLHNNKPQVSAAICYNLTLRLSRLKA